jgi:hypothetical protein
VALLGGTAADAANDVAVAPDGSVLVGGGFSTFLFTDTVSFGLNGAASPLTAGGYGQEDAFITQATSAGVFNWVATLGSTYEDATLSVTADAAGNVIAAGQFGGGAIGAGTAAGEYNGVVQAQLAGLGGFDGFVVSAALLTGALNWVLPIGGSADDVVSAVAVDASNNILAAGSCTSVACYAGATFLFNNDDVTGATSDAFLVKLTPAGAVMWSFAASGDAEDTATGVAVDTFASGSGNIYLAGQFSSTSLTMGAAASAPVLPAMGSASPPLDGYLVALSPAGAVLWTQHLTGSGSTQGMNVAAADGSLFVSSSFTNNLAVMDGAVIQESPDSYKATMMVARLTSAGALTLVAPIGSDYTASLAVSADGSTACIAGAMVGAVTNPTATFGDVLGAGGPSLQVTTAGTTDGVSLCMTIPPGAVPLVAAPPPIVYVNVSGPTVYVPVPGQAPPAPGRPSAPRAPGAPGTPGAPGAPKTASAVRAISEGGLDSIGGGGGLAGIIIGTVIFGSCLGCGVALISHLGSKAAAPRPPAAKISTCDVDSVSSPRPAAPAPAADNDAAQAV